VRLAIDSNRYTDLCVGDEQAVSVIRGADEIHLPLVVLAELRSGFAHGARRGENERLLTRFLNSPRVRVVSPDEQTTQFYAEIYVDLRKKGRPIPTNDLWIAALVMQHGLVLFDRDSHLDHVRGLARV
jgi:predicted nucleic acid-binding protein